jgi:DNA replication factor GINS
LDISELVGIHSIGHGLTNVKVEFNNDLKLNVSDISIEGKKGEILNIPRWVADVLQSEKHVEIKDSETLVELKQAAMKEEVHGDFDLITLEPHFYIKIKSYMKRLPEKDHVKVESLLNKLLRTRQTKIIRLADSSKLTAEISQKLSVEEHEFYNQIHELSTKFSKKIVGDKK